MKQYVDRLSGESAIAAETFMDIASEDAAWPWADTWPIARLVVPSLVIDRIVLERVYRRTPAFGPGRLESYVPTREGGTMILTGHRSLSFCGEARTKLAGFSAYC